MGCSGVCIWFVAQIIIQYLSNSTYLRVEEYQEIPTNFPMVSFCNMKPMNFSSPLVQAYVSSASGFWFIPTFSQPSSNKYNITSLHEWSGAENMLLMRLLNQDPFGVITNANRKLFGYQIEDMLVSCYFNFQPCFSTDFTYVQGMEMIQGMEIVIHSMKGSIQMVQLILQNKLV